MIIFFMVGVISFLCVGKLWIISSLIHRPILMGRISRSTEDQNQQEDNLDEKQAAVTIAIWTILHPLS